MREGRSGRYRQFPSEGWSAGFHKAVRFSWRLIAEILPRVAVGKRDKRGARGVPTHLGGGDARDGVDGSDSSHCYRSVCAVMVGQGRRWSTTNLDRGCFSPTAKTMNPDWLVLDSGLVSAKIELVAIGACLGYVLRIWVSKSQNPSVAKRAVRRKNRRCSPSVPRVVTKPSHERGGSG